LLPNVARGAGPSHLGSCGPALVRGQGEVKPSSVGERLAREGGFPG
jgi:hypothetical protein